MNDDQGYRYTKLLSADFGGGICNYEIVHKGENNVSSNFSMLRHLVASPHKYAFVEDGFVVGKGCSKRSLIP